MAYIRNSHIISHPPLNGVSAMINNDVASMYPSMMSSMNMGKSIFNNKTTYYVQREFPFKIISSAEFFKDGQIYLKHDLDVIIKSEKFDRKIEAMRYRLERLVIHAPTAEKCQMYKNRLATLEEDYPEWVI